MLRPITEFISDEAKAEDSANAIKAALLLEDSDNRDDVIYRNAKHLQIVLPTLNVSATKRSEYQKLVADHLVD